ncbi:zinc-binding dehydrogenase [Altererythrobacter indicus]|uniref:Zinc-binding dehydrogenase n=1 Tax=Altericroceibacterium indicum TaxID=374177 RepID=A0A845AB78_9SPHN|nr:NAD(P)H-quinone oxidoreductase [Altericroceibacterium indicum]MXP26503.1 zinc-binding dehydrogenase [Altericroceibacterium indicum]
MTAIGFDEPGAADVLYPTQVSIPQPSAGEVLIKVAYAGVNRPDVIQRQGNYPPPEGASPILGLEVSGEVVAVGEAVDDAMIGQKVCALTPGGGYAQYCVTQSGHCLPIPKGLSSAEAAALPETIFTVWHNVFERAWATEGETLLIHGGTSGIGTMATMLAKLYGLKVIVTCGSDAKCDAARSIGADHAINYRKVDFVEAVKEITKGKGLQIVLDMVAGEYTPRSLQCLASDGRLVTIAVLGGAKATINMAQVMVRRLTITGSTLRARSDTFKTLLAQEISRNAWPFVESGQLRPVMDKSFPLSDVIKAHERMEAGQHIGKIVLEIGD